MKSLSLSIPNARISVKALKELSFFLFFCFPLIRRCFAWVMSQVGLSAYAAFAAIIVVYFPVFLAFIVSPKSIKLDFFAVFTLIVLFFLITYLIHPEYEYVYARGNYGVLRYVLRPDNGLYAYFFLRLLDDPKDILKNLKRAAWAMYVYYGFLFTSAMIVGYWVDEGSKGQVVHLSYSLTFGYDLLLFCLIFFYSALTKRKVVDIVMTVIGLVMILLGGSRGPLMCVAIFLVLYALRSANTTKKKCVYILSLLVVSGILLAFYDVLLLAVARIFEGAGGTSRTIQMLLEGNALNGTGRATLWNTTLQMIQENPLGWGAMGTRHVLYKIHVVGHPHQIFLELLVDFGVIVGTCLIVFLIVNVIRVFRVKNYEWTALFLIFFSRACHLFISGTFWHLLPFWACIGIGVSALHQEKSLRRGNIL